MKQRRRVVLEGTYFTRMPIDHLTLLYIPRSGKDGLDQLDVVGLHLYGSGDDRGDLDEETAVAGAAAGLEVALTAVERAADDADLVMAHGRRDLLGTVVAGGIAGLDGGLEGVHLLIAHDHRLASLEETVLKGGRTQDDGIEDGAAVVCEDEVVEERDIPALAPAVDREDLTRHRREALDADLLQHPICRSLRVGAGKVPHHEPSYLVLIHYSFVVLGLYSLAFIRLYLAFKDSTLQCPWVISSARKSKSGVQG